MTERKRCKPCEGGVPKLTPAEAVEQGKETPLWEIDDESLAITRTFKCNRFTDAVELINKIAEIAEDQGHHPDLHLTGYRNLKVLLTTHAISGLSKNDFIVAGDIDRVCGS